MLTCSVNSSAAPGARSPVAMFFSTMSSSGSGEALSACAYAEPQMLNRRHPGSGSERRPRPGVWNLKWDRQEPLCLFNPRKRNLESGVQSGPLQSQGHAGHLPRGGASSTTRRFPGKGLHSEPRRSTTRKFARRLRSQHRPAERRHPIAADPFYVTGRRRLCSIPKGSLDRGWLLKLYPASGC